jgi:hypothetical protein
MFIAIHPFVSLVNIFWDANPGCRAVSVEGLWPLLAGIVGSNPKGGVNMYLL